MKYIKLYEDSYEDHWVKLKYKAGDYVLVEDSVLFDNTDVTSRYAYIESIDHSNIPYRCVWTDGYNFWLKESEITRLLTPSEIESGAYHLQTTTNKFNL